MEKFDVTFKIFDERGTAFNPIATIIIGNLADLPDTGAVDMPAEDGVDAVSFGIPHNGILECADKIDRVFDPFLGVRAQGPIAQPETASDEID